VLFFLDTWGAGARRFQAVNYLQYGSIYKQKKEGNSKAENRKPKTDGEPQEKRKKKTQNGYNTDN